MDHCRVTCLCALLLSGCVQQKTEANTYDLMLADASGPRDFGDAASSDGPLQDAATDLSVGAVSDMPVGSDMSQPTTPVAPLSYGRDTTENGFTGDEYAWIDADDLPRSVLLTHNNTKDGANHWGGVARRITYEHGGTTRNCVGNLAAHPGFGKIISHYGSTSTGSNVQGTFSRFLAGRHHAIHEYKWVVGFGGPTANVTVHWFFANGRSNPVYAVTYDLNGTATANQINGDSRSPYGDIQWDYGNNANVDGVGWGDHYQFRTVGDPVCKKLTDMGTCNCAIGGEGTGTCWTWNGWDYSQPNVVPHAMEWANSVDAEMGIVQTQSYSQHESGGYWFYGNWGAQDFDGPMPEDYNWAYQLNQYEPSVDTQNRPMKDT